tara:strand:- start:67 stop:885 length:819 start_codon:yes stop_codon:yes gene_type:complete
MTSKIINNFLDLKTRLNDNSSLSVIRLGNVEMTSLLNKNNNIYDEMKTNAGFFCKDKSKELEVYKIWKNKYIKSILNCDLNLDVVTCNSFQILGQLLNNLNHWLPSLAYIETPDWWIESVINEYQGTIGIVSYFKEDIENQIKVLDKIWPKHNIKNKFIVVKSLNTIKGNEPSDFDSFTEVYNDLEKRVLKEQEPKLWLVSAGCYGLPLCNAIKNDGRKAIYVGGLLQILFGLKGKRWDTRKEVNRFYNKHWKYPTIKPKNGELVEGGCYWN